MHKSKPTLLKTDKRMHLTLIFHENHVFGNILRYQFIGKIRKVIKIKLMRIYADKLNIKKARKTVAAPEKMVRFHQLKCRAHIFMFLLKKVMCRDNYSQNPLD